MTQKASAKDYILLHILLIIYSCSGILTKLASQQTFLSLPYLFFWCGVLFIMGLYALGWQQVIKRIPLGVAMANKSIVTIWGIIWGMFLFGEKLTLGMIIGPIFIFGGVYMVTRHE